MKLEDLNQEVQNKAMEVLQTSDNKEQALAQAIDMIVTAKNSEVVKQLQEERDELEAGKQSAQALGLRALNKSEKAFYEKITTANQSVTFTQDDVIPTSIIDKTLADVKEKSDTLKLVNIAPADVKKWIVASKTGVASWGNLTDELTSELTANIESLNIEVNKLYVTLVVPKAVRELGLAFVDKYFNAILAEAMHDGLVDGYLNGDGKTAPVGIFKKIGETNSDGTATAKTNVGTITGFTPKSLAPVLKALSNDGLRKVSKLHLIANPNDVHEYINPALFMLTGGGYVSTAKMDIEVIQEPMCEAGRAVFTIEGEYTMGLSGIRIDEYKEVKALDDCDVFIAKTYANGRATDDNTAYVFNPTKLVEFVPSVSVTGTVDTGSAE